MTRYLKNVTTLELLEERCTGCGMCEEVCPHGVMKMHNGRAAIADRDACMECGACSRNCPEGAITVQSGVGCAQAVINTALGRRSSSCCDLDDYKTTDPVCETASPGGGCGEIPKRRSGSGCC